MSRMYTAQFNAVAVTAQQDFFEVVAPADAVVVLHGIELSQVTETGDAMEEQLQILLKRGQTTSGSGGSTVTPNPTEFGDAAFGGTVEANNTTKATAGTITTHQVPDWNVRMPYLFIPTPEMRFKLSPSQRATLELATTPADSITISGCIWIEEIGG